MAKKDDAAVKVTPETVEYLAGREKFTTQKVVKHRVGDVRSDLRKLSIPSVYFNQLHKLTQTHERLVALDHDEMATATLDEIGRVEGLLSRSLAARDADEKVVAQFNEEVDRKAIEALNIDRDALRKYISE
jgi:hypothetical protein